MEKFIVSLTKSYLIEIEAKNEDEAKRFSEYYTSDIRDLSDKNNEFGHQFSITNIECTSNEAHDCKPLIEN